MTDTPKFEPCEITQSRGPTLIFNGRMIAHTEFESRGRDPHRMRLEIWESEGGALIALTEGEPIERKGRAIVDATVVEPILTAETGSGPDKGRVVIDSAAMRFAILDHFEWEDRARSMVRDQLGWSLKRVVR